MSTTVSLVNMPSSSPSDVSVYFLDQTKLALRSEVQSADGRTNTATYVYADGSLAYETLITVTVSNNLKTGVRNTSIRLATVQTVAVDSLPVEETPIEVVIAFNVQGPVMDATALLRMIGTAYSLTFDGVTTKVPNGGIIGALARGLTHEIYG